MDICGSRINLKFPSFPQVSAELCPLLRKDRGFLGENKLKNKDMIEILFRGKCAIGDRWVYGDLIHDPDCQNPQIGYVVNYSGNGIDEPPSSSYVKFEVVPETIGQFTGLTDKNGVKIFEGDILSYTDVYSVVLLPVSFLNGKFMKQETRPDSHKWLSTNDHYFDLSFRFGKNEVIGNIHEK